MPKISYFSKSKKKWKFVIKINHRPTDCHVPAFGSSESRHLRAPTPTQKLNLFIFFISVEPGKGIWCHKWSLCRWRPLPPSAHIRWPVGWRNGVYPTFRISTELRLANFLLPRHASKVHWAPLHKMRGRLGRQCGRRRRRSRQSPNRFGEILPI